MTTLRRRFSLSLWSQSLRPASRSSLVTLVACALVATASVARAEGEPAPSPPPRFGQQGQIVLPDVLGYSNPFGWTVGPFSFSESSTTQPATAPGTVPTEQHMASVYFAPSADVVVFDHVTLGARAFVVNSHWRGDAVAGDGSTYSMEANHFAIGVTPRVGYVLALTRELSLWPRAGAGASTALNGSQKGGSGFNASGEVALVYQPARSFIVSIGPQILYGFNDVLGEGKTTSVTLGGFAHAGLVF